MKVEPAIITEIVPKDAINWKKERSQEWAREILAGGPPDKPEDPLNGNIIDWDDLKKWVGKKIRIRARPKGLIVYSDDGSKRFVPGDTSSSQKTSSRKISVRTEDMRKKSSIELKIREFVKKEISIYNKQITKTIRDTEKRKTTLEFWESGKRIRYFLTSNKEINEDNIWYALDQWGQGQYGYGTQTFRYATYFYDWKNEIMPNNPIFSLSETRIMNILRASKDDSERERLLEACISGPFKSLTDVQFKWATGQSRGTIPPSDKKLFNEIKKISKKIKTGEKLSKTENEHLIKLLSNLKVNNPNPDNKNELEELINDGK